MKRKTDDTKHDTPGGITRNKDDTPHDESLARACARAGEVLGLCRSLFDNPNLAFREAFPDEDSRNEVLARIDAAGRECDAALERYGRAKRPGSN